MLRPSLLAALVVIALFLAPLTGHAGPYGKPEKAEKKIQKRLVKVTRKGEAYCFDAPIVHGNVVVATGRCYTFYVMRTSNQSFLGFGPPGPPMIPPGQLVRMNTPAGAKTKGRLFYVVPLSRPVTSVPVGTIQYVPVVVVPQPNQIVIRVPVTGSPSAGSTKDPEADFFQR
jgi:hypothetical protein